MVHFQTLGFLATVRAAELEGDLDLKPLGSGQVVDGRVGYGGAALGSSSAYHVRVVLSPGSALRISPFTGGQSIRAAFWLMSFCVLSVSFENLFRVFRSIFPLIFQSRLFVFLIAFSVFLPPYFNISLIRRFLLGGVPFAPCRLRFPVSCSDFFSVVLAILSPVGPFGFFVFPWHSRTTLTIRENRGRTACRVVSPTRLAKRRSSYVRSLLSSI